MLNTLSVDTSILTVYERVSGRGGVTEARIVNRRKERYEGHCTDHLLVFG